MQKKSSRHSTRLQLRQYRFDDALAPMKHLAKIVRVGASTLDAQVVQQMLQRFAEDVRLGGIDLDLHA